VKKERMNITGAFRTDRISGCQCTLFTPPPPPPWVLSSVAPVAFRARIKKEDRIYSIGPVIAVYKQVFSSSISSYRRRGQLSLCFKTKFASRPNDRCPWPGSRQLPHPIKRFSPHYHFFGGNFGSPIPLPLSLIPSTLSMAPRTFWSGAAVPLSKSWTTVTVVLHFVARSFCVILGWISFRRLTIACPTSKPTVLGFTISSERSTLVRCWPSTDDL
jgi:hypothetical protein